MLLITREIRTVLKNILILSFSFPIVVDCGPINIPENGQVNTDESHSGTTYNSVAVYSCNEGYLLKGVAERTCLATGQWSPLTSSCVRKSVCVCGKTK